VVSGPEEMRKAVRLFLKYGVDSIKLNLSGDNFVPHADSKTNWMADEEVAMAVRETKLRGKRNIVHARSMDSIRQALRHGIEVLYHVSFTDAETLDLLEAQKSRIFVVPTFSVLVKLAYEGAPYGAAKGSTMQRNMEEELEACAATMRALHKRGVRILPGGDYGFDWAKHGDNATDLQYLVKYAGMTPMEAIVSATRLGGEIMMKPDELGQVKEGYLADLLLVDGDPLADLAILLDTDKLLAVMKDGVFHKEPELRSSRTRWSLPAA
jgi:imidazolonepropionase-like amidohydrolase